MANANYSQYAQGHVESTTRVRNAIKSVLANIRESVEKINVMQRVNCEVRLRASTFCVSVYMV